MLIRGILRNVRWFFDKTFDIYNYLILAVVFLFTAYPFWYILVYSISDPVRLKAGFLLLPYGFSVDAYIAALKSADILRAFLMSVLRSTIGPISSSLISMMAAYALSRRDLPGRKFFIVFFIITMYFGAGLIPYYLLLKKLMLINTFWLYIIPGIMNVYGMILMRTYIESLPSSLHESAYIDGANELVVFFRIIVPLCVPVIAAITLFSCVGHWNSYTDTLIYNSAKPKLYTLQYVLMTFVTTVAATQSDNAINNVISQTRQTRLTPMTVRMAITIITVMPISLVYPFLQKYFIKGILIGAVKG